MKLAAGVDTWSICWYLGPDSPGARAMKALATRPSKRSQLLEEPVAGHVVGWFPATRLLFAEGHPEEDALAKSHQLPAAADRVVEQLTDRGILPPSRRWSPMTSPSGPRLPDGGTGFAGIRRLDSTVDLSFDDPLVGLAALGGVAALPLPRMQTGIRREAGGRRVETVYFYGYNGKRVLARWYDKGYESGAAQRGCLIRPEDQRRFTAGTRPPLDAIAEGTYVRDSFVRRFEPLWRAAKGIKVGGIMQLAVQVGELVDQGEMKPGEAKRVLGAICLDSAGCKLQSRATRMRDRALMRDNGLVVADGILEEVDVDLHDVMEQAFDSSSWGEG